MSNVLDEDVLESMAEAFIKIILNRETIAHASRRTFVDRALWNTRTMARWTFSMATRDAELVNEEASSWTVTS